MLNQEFRAPAEQEPNCSTTTEPQETSAEECRRRMLQWPNPVEYVNDMYGCHPGGGDTEYFRTVFGK
ncbi:MAG: hypothetical protein KAV82_03480 [Phycisphaerae bacterium]|nr:hypothetical protein [Phycisphaerae bacterium]